MDRNRDSEIEAIKIKRRKINAAIFTAFFWSIALADLLWIKSGCIAFVCFSVPIFLGVMYLLNKKLKDSTGMSLFDWY